MFSDCTSLPLISVAKCKEDVLWFLPASDSAFCSPITCTQDTLGSEEGMSKACCSLGRRARQGQ